jgi:hypothetical protein
VTTPPPAVHIARHPVVITALLDKHTVDHLGYCRGCELPQAGPMRWPCTLWVTATRARALVGSPEVRLLALHDLVDARAEGRIQGHDVDALIERLTIQLEKDGIVTGDFLND